MRPGDRRRTSAASSSANISARNDRNLTRFKCHHLGCRRHRGREITTTLCLADIGLMMADGDAPSQLFQAGASFPDWLRSEPADFVSASTTPRRYRSSGIRRCPQMNICLCLSTSPSAFSSCPPKCRCPLFRSCCCLSLSFVFAGATLSLALMALLRRHNIHTQQWFPPHHCAAYSSCAAHESQTLLIAENFRSRYGQSRAVQFRLGQKDGPAPPSPSPSAFRKLMIVTSRGSGIREPRASRRQSAIRNRLAPARATTRSAARSAGMSLIIRNRTTWQRFCSLIRRRSRMIRRASPVWCGMVINRVFMVASIGSASSLPS